MRAPSKPSALHAVCPPSPPAYTLCPLPPHTLRAAHLKSSTARSRTAASKPASPCGPRPSITPDSAGRRRRCAVLACRLRVCRAAARDMHARSRPRRGSASRQAYARSALQSAPCSDARMHARTLASITCPYSRILIRSYTYKYIPTQYQEHTTTHQRTRTYLCTCTYTRAYVSVRRALVRPGPLAGPYSLHLRPRQQDSAGNATAAATSAAAAAMQQQLCFLSFPNPDSTLCSCCCCGGGGVTC
jgi:hypothetical protein